MYTDEPPCPLTLLIFQLSHKIEAASTERDRELLRYAQQVLIDWRAERYRDVRLVVKVRR